MVSEIKPCPTCNLNSTLSHWYAHKQHCTQCTKCNVFHVNEDEHKGVCARTKYRCGKCTKVFSRNSNLKDHVRLNRCQACPRGCGQYYVTGKGKSHHEINCPLRGQYSTGLLPTGAEPAGIAYSLPSPDNSVASEVDNRGQLYRDINQDGHGRLQSVVNASDNDDATFNAVDDATSVSNQQHHDFLELVARYNTRAAAALQDATYLFQEQHDRAPPDSRAKIDSHHMVALLDKVTIGHAISAVQASRTNPRDRPRDEFVLCTMAEAEWLLNEGPPQIPILVVDATSHHLKIKINRFLDILCLRDHLDVHIFETRFRKDPQGRLIYAPERYPSIKAVQLFNERRNGAGLPVNLLNLGCTKDNGIPACFAANSDFAPLARTHVDNGKAETPMWNDLDDCITFQLLASKGAAHLPHIDRHGVYTTALAEEGKKLWLLWPHLSLEELKGQKIPHDGVAVLIDEGDMLIQPPSTLHALITLEDCLMTGTMHWHSSHLLYILRFTKAEVQQPELTNEAMARQFVLKMTQLLNQWKRDSTDAQKEPLYGWPPIEHMEECFGILKWLKDGCGCGDKMCRRNNCRCKLSGRTCDARCHFSNTDKACCQVLPKEKVVPEGETVRSKESQRVRRKTMLAQPARQSKRLKTARD